MAAQRTVTGRRSATIDVGAVIVAYDAGASLETIARQLGVGYPTLRAALVAADVPIPVRSMRLSAKAKLLTDEVLRQRFVDEGRTAGEIAVEFELGRATVYRRLRAVRIGVSRQAPTIELTDDYLRREYVERGRTSDDIGAEAGVSRTVVLARLRELGLPVRPPGVPALFTREQADRFYVGQGLNVSQTAERSGCSISLVSRRLRQWGYR